MSRGFITVAQNSAYGNYLQAAYALALSLRKTQRASVANLSVMVTPGTEVPDRYRAVFDQVIEVPWGDMAARDEWKIQNKWKVYYASPYDETILLDADMLMPIDIFDWWNILRKRSVFACTSPYTFRGDPILGSVFREAFDRCGLPHVYTAFFYFKKSERVRKYFRMVEHAYIHWDALRTQFPGLPKNVSGDLAFAMGMKLSGTENEFTSKEWPGIVHMKSELQQIGNNVLPDWTNHLGVQVRDDGSIHVGGYFQRWPFHYHIKTFLTDAIIERLERE
jgi:hypothetical protein